MLASLVKSIEWRHSSDEGKTAVVMDDAVAEALKWNLSDTHLPANCLLLSLAIDADTLSQLSYNDVSRYLVFTSKLSNSVGLAISHMLRASSAAECCILSSVSPEAAEFTPFTNASSSTVGTGSGYEGLQMMLAPVKARVTYFPFHAIQIIASNPPLQPDQVSLGVLVAHTSRTAVPLTLSALSGDAAAEREADPREYHSVLDVNASDLPAEVKVGLKSLAHDLAGALVFDYDLDVSASVHALGKTSSILGYNILPVLEQLTEQRNNRASERRTQSGLALRTHLNTTSGIETGTSSASGTSGTSGVSGGASPSRSRAPAFVPLQPAALVLIDRTEDLLTPASAGSIGGTPLAHRILNTLNYCQYLNSNYEGKGESGDSLQCDVSLRCPLLEVVEADTAARLLGMHTDATTTSTDTNEVIDPRDGNWNAPMSALANLPLQLTPSLVYKPIATNNTSTTSNTTHPVLVHLLADAEDAARVALCNEIKAHITANNGVLPPNKKRGLGAEMLAYTQALIAAPGSTSTDTTTPTNPANTANTTTSTPLLSLTYTVIESMQRSSQKQFTTLCDWQCAYDVRTAREAELNAIAGKMEDFDVCVAHLLTYFLSNNSGTSGGAGSSASPKASSGVGGVASPSKSLNRVSSAKSVVSEKEAPSTAGPVDVVHILVQLLRLTSLFRQRHNTNASNGSGGSGASVNNGSLAAFTECLCDYLVHKSCVAELQYLQGLRFLTTSTVKEVLLHRQRSAELDVLYSAQIQGADSGAYPPENEGIEDRIASLELGLKQLYSSVRDQVTLSLHAMYTLQHLYSEQRGMLLEGNTNSSGDVAKSALATNECLDLLGGVDRDGEVTGLVARIAQAYLIQRGANLNVNNPSAADPLLRMFEFIESPMQKVKRAGLGLLSMGLGSLGFGFGSQVASVATTPHPSDQPTLVLFVLGGISYKEVGQVQQAIRKYAVPNTRVMILSTRLVSAENVLYSFFA